MIKSDLSNVKVGDTIWTIQEGYTKVLSTRHEDEYPIKTENKSYTLAGRILKDHKHPSAFFTNPFEQFQEREMWVSDDNKKWEKRVVFYHNPKLRFPYLVYKGDITEGYIYVKEIEEIPEYTMEELIKKVGYEFKIKK